jgi:glycosyltransferase involved in cell wall biosynthesis
VHLLYYNTSLHSSYSAGTHASEVFHALKQIKDITVQAYPDSAASTPPTPSSPKSIIRSWSGILPYWTLLAWLLWLKDHRPKLPSLGKSESWVVFIRTDLRIKLLRHLKQQSQVALLCAEVNALIAEEVPHWLPWRSQWIKQEVHDLNQADLIMVVSSYLKQRLVGHGIQAEKILVNHNGVNPNHFDPAHCPRIKSLRGSWGVPENGFVFGYVGGMETFRKLPQIIAIFAEFARQHPESYLLIIGAGPDMKQVAKSRETLAPDLQRRIHLAGVIPYKDVPAAMACFDCAIFPFSNPYGSPQKIFEYLAMGLPVIGPDVPAVTEVFKDRQHMRLAKQDGNDLHALFEEMLEQPARNQEMARCGRDLVLREYTWDANAWRLHTFLKEHLPVEGR